MKHHKLNRLRAAARLLARSISRPTRVFLHDAGHGLLEVCHNSLAVIGLAVVAALVFFASRDDIRHAVEIRAFGWLQARHEAPPDAALAEAQADAALQLVGDASAVTRATAIDPTELDRQQAAVASWLSRRYRVAQEPIARLVLEAWQTGQRTRIEPTLILAIMAIESSFNPFAQSSVGAQGLMQVMTHVHDDKYEAFGGNHAAFDPVTNLRVGAQVLRECIARAGSVEAGLRYYVGAANLPADGGYVAKVLAEQAHLRAVASGRRVAINAPNPVPTTPAVEPAAPDEQKSASAASQQIAMR